MEEDGKKGVMQCRGRWEKGKWKRVKKVGGRGDGRGRQKGGGRDRGKMEGRGNEELENEKGMYVSFVEQVEDQ